MTTRFTARGFRRSLACALVVAGLLAGLVPAAPGAAATGSEQQFIQFLPPYSAAVGDTLSLDAWASSDLAVTFDLAPTTVCTLSGTTLGFVDVGTCDITASQVGNGTYGAATDVTRTIVSALGYEATWSIATPDDSSRDPGTIQVGDQLSLSLAASDDTPVTSCDIRITSIGGWLMQHTGSLRDGACQLMATLPEFTDLAARAAADRSDRDVCVSFENLTFADSQPRELVSGDRLTPGGVACYNGSDRSPREDRLLDFRVVTGGSHQPFASDPPMISWNPVNWVDYTPLRFGSTAHLELPSLATHCTFLLNGGWDTSISPASPAGCAAWDVRIPGVLPSTLPWPGSPGNWPVEIVANYSTSGATGLAIGFVEMPYEPSDGIFESSQPAVFPFDLANTRFVTVGETWQPAFTVTGGIPEHCAMAVLADDHSVATYPATTVDPDGTCHFDVPAFATEWDSHQYAVSADVPAGSLTYAATITAIALPSPPTIADPTTDTGGTTFRVTEGSGQGLLIDLSVAPGETGSANHLAGAQTATAAADACTASAISIDISNGGSIPPIATSCDLPPGTYTATAHMYDATGKITSATRVFVVELPAPSANYRSPSSGATNVRRNVAPVLGFDMAVKGVSATTVRLRDVGLRAYIITTVSYDTTTHRATLHPAALLRAGATFRLSLTSGITGISGRPIAPTNWTFTVSSDSSAPRFTASPAAGATGISRQTNVVLHVSERVLGVSASTLRLKDVATGAYVAAVVTYDAVHERIVINPSATLRSHHRYLVVVANGITDRAGNPLAARSWSFTTRR